VKTRPASVRDCREMRRAICRATLSFLGALRAGGFGMRLSCEPVGVAIRKWWVGSVKKEGIESQGVV
jgi:hypothetical protein